MVFYFFFYFFLVFESESVSLGAAVSLLGLNLLQLPLLAKGKTYIFCKYYNTMKSISWSSLLSYWLHWAKIFILFKYLKNVHDNWWYIQYLILTDC